MSEDVKESAEEKLDKMKQGEIDKLDDMDVADIVVETEEDDDKNELSFAYQKPTWDAAKKVTIKTKRLMHTVRLRITKEVWKEAGQDEKMFSYLFQLAQMKQTFVTVNKRKCNTTFWEFADDEWIENTRKLMFGPNPLEASPFSEKMLKNLQGELKSAIELMETTEKDSKEANNSEKKE